MTLIALHSKGQQAGKDTIADIIHTWCIENSRSFTRLAFADKMKQLVALTLDHGSAQEQNWEEAIRVVDEFKLNGSFGWSLQDQPMPPLMTGRDFIINLAEGCRELFGREFWLNQTLPINWQPTTDITVITDLRFHEEAVRVSALGGHIVEVKSPRVVDPGGRSEKGIDPNFITVLIDNNGTIDELESTVFDWMDEIEGIVVTDG